MFARPLGENGYIRLRRVDPETVDDLSLECKMEFTTEEGIVCTKDDKGDDVFPDPALVCGTSGILYDAVLPVGGHLV